MKSNMLFARAVTLLALAALALSAQGASFSHALPRGIGPEPLIGGDAQNALSGSRSTRGAAPQPDSLRAARLLQSVAMGDFNGDGVMDFAVADFLSDNVLVILGDGKGHFRLSAKLPSGTGPRAIVAGDFNHDGVTDLATANFFSGTLTIFLGRRDGSFEEPRTIQLEKGLSSIISADFDADGIPDLAVANFFSGEVVILKGVGDGTFEVRSRVGPIRGGIVSL